MEFITTYVLPPIFLGFLVALIIVGVQHLMRRMGKGRSVDSAPTRPAVPPDPKSAKGRKRVCANGHAKAGGQKFCDECGQQ